LLKVGKGDRAAAAASVTQIQWPWAKRMKMGICGHFRGLVLSIRNQSWR
jgi:hypothetical protein